MSFKDTAISQAVYILERIASHKLNISIDGDEAGIRIFRAGTPAVYVLWHHDIPAMIAAFRNNGLYLLMSMSRDGQSLKYMISKFGYRSVRGSSTRGYINALRAGIDTIEDGGSLCVTPDGPKGPGRLFKEGALYFSKMTGVPVIPGAAAVEHKIVFNSWDRMELPLPYSLVNIWAGNPIYYDGNISSEENVKKASDALLEAEKKAEEALRRRVLSLR